MDSDFHQEGPYEVVCPPQTLQITIMGEEEGTINGKKVPTMYLNETYRVTLEGENPIGKLWILVNNLDTPHQRMKEPFLHHPPVRCSNYPEIFEKIKFQRQTYKTLAIEIGSTTANLDLTISTNEENYDINPHQVITIPVIYYANWEIVFIKWDHGKFLSTRVPILVNTRPHHQRDRVHQLLHLAFHGEDQISTQTRMIKIMDQLESSIRAVYEDMGKMKN